MYKDEISEKTRLIGQLNEQIIELKTSGQKPKKFEVSLTFINSERDFHFHFFFLILTIILGRTE